MKNIGFKSQSGFSLIELTIVLLIVSLLGLGALKSIGTIREKISFSETNNSLDKITASLQLFLINNNRLPCPADPTLDSSDANYGLEMAAATATTNVCDASRTIGIGFVGVLPFNSLNLDPSIRYDGWNQQYTYAVAANTTTFESYTQDSWTPGGNIIQVLNDSATAVPITNEAIFVLVSHGPNGNGSIRINGNVSAASPAGATDELENLRDDLVFVDAIRTDDEVAPYDDVMVFKTEEQLVFPLEQLGSLESKRKIVNEQLDAIEHSLFDAIASNNTDPDGVPSDPATPAPLYCSCVAGYIYPSGPNIGLEIPVCSSGCNRTIRHAIEPPSGGAIPVPFVALNLTQADVTDPWGTPIDYIIGAGGLLEDFAGTAGTEGIYSNSAAATLYTLTSAGPDTNLATIADNITRTVTPGEMVGRLAAAGIKVD